MKLFNTLALLGCTSASDGSDFFRGFLGGIQMFQDIDDDKHPADCFDVTPKS